MSRPKSKKNNPEKRLKPGVKTKVYVRDDMIGGGKVELLRLVEEHGSISAAAREMGINYRRAWFLIDTLQKCFEDPILIAERGGSGSGGTTITPLGKELLRRHAELLKAVAETSADFLSWMEANQPKESDH